MHESDNCWHWYRHNYPWQLAYCIISIKLSWSEVPWRTWTKFGMRQPYNNLQMVTRGFLYSDRATPTTTVVENRRGRDLYTSVQPPKTGAANLIILVQTLPKTTMKMTPLSAWLCVCAHTHTYNGPLSRTIGVSQYQKYKNNLDFTETRQSEWRWHQLGHMQVCTSLQTYNHASTPALSFFTGQMLFLPPNQQRQSTEGNVCACKCLEEIVTRS